MTFLYLRTIVCIIISISLLACDKARSPERLELSLDLTDYSYLRDYQIGVDFHIHNPTEGVILISHVTSEGNTLWDLAYKKLIYHSSHGDTELRIETRPTEEQRNPDLMHFTTMHRFVVVPPNGFITYELIASTKDRKPITQLGTIEARFNGRVRNLNTGLDSLKIKESFLGNYLDGAYYSKLEFFEISAVSPPVNIPIDGSKGK